jgi:hypothetical protein
MFECESWTDELGQFRPGKLCARENEVEPENGANIRLIASAPELLEALENIFPHAAVRIQGTTDGEPILEQARSAIRKARGEA